MPDHQKDYRVVRATSVDTLVQEVTKGVQHGYTPIGGMQYFVEEKKNDKDEITKSVIFFQTLFKG